jgi:hypothetical protein
MMRSTPSVASASTSASAPGPMAPLPPVVSSMASGSRPCSSAVDRTVANSSASSSWVPLAWKKASPGRPARRAATRVWPPTWMGIVPSTGLGLIMQSSKRTNSPSKLARSCSQSARSAATFSSVRRPRSSKGTPMASSSSRSQPEPMPSSSRPPER